MLQWTLWCMYLFKVWSPSLQLIDLGHFLFSFSMQVNPADSENFASMVELTFVFSMIWSVCASVDEEGRKKIDSYLREIEGTFPNKVRALQPSCPSLLYSWSSDLLSLSLLPSCLSSSQWSMSAFSGQGKPKAGFGNLTHIPSSGHSVRVFRGPKDPELDIVWG